MAEYSAEDIAVDADRTPPDPRQVAGEQVPDPWDEDPERWDGTEPTWPF